MADKQWYMTVGFPGGEFAAKVADVTRFESQLPPLQHYEIPCFEGDRSPHVCTRPCPPDLVEWIEARDVEGNEPGLVMRYKVPSGWICLAGSMELAQTLFVPVLGAAGLTVLEESNAD